MKEKHEKQKENGQQGMTEKKTAFVAPNKRKKWWMVLSIAVAVVCIFTGLIAWNAYVHVPAPQPVLATETPPVPSQRPTAGAPSVSTVPRMLPAMQTLYEQNSDIVGWINIEGTQVNYPVMYTPQDGEYYLYRNFEKEEDPTKEGCIFIDKNCMIEPRSTNLIFHGHNMKNGTMFHALIDYKEEDFYREHKIVRFDTLYEEEEYEIAAVFLTKIYNKSDTDVFKFYQFYHANNEEEFNSYIQSCKDLALYETGVTPKYGDELITLSTCEYSTDNGRIVVVARKLTDKKAAVASGEIAA